MPLMEPPPLDATQHGRRRFLKTLVVSAAAVPFVGGWPRAMAMGGMDDAARTRALAHFPQSVASGDPRPDRVLLWTRAPAADGADVPLRLEVADDAGFTRLRVQRELRAEAAADHCVRVRVTGLEPGRAYHYRFLRQVEGVWQASPVGRTRTAPAKGDAASARFAVLSCQDYGGRWYNSLLPLLDEAPDFLIHLGDFIYETIGDPRFQSEQGARTIRFDDIAGALPVGKKDAHFLAARSLDNYRQLHRTVRGDEVLQKLLESAPLVAIWDDHEFADDCWGDASTYLNGITGEADPGRRRNAEQAYFEYLPVDVEVGEVDAEGQSRVDVARLYPQTRLWRELHWGRDLQLLLTDHRSHRPDHAIPEDAFPGALAFDAEAIARLLPASGFDPAIAASQLLPYLDLDDKQWQPLRKPLRRALTHGYADAGLDKRAAAQRADAAARGKVAVFVIRTILTRYNAAVPGFMHAELPPAEGDYPRGLPWLALGKQALFGEVGSRYFVVKDAFDLLQALRAAEAAAAPTYGPAQAAWLRDALAQPAPRWRVLASSVAMVPMVLDLSRPEIGAPALMQRRFYLNLDQWDGFGRERDGWIAGMDASGGALVLSGDIHSGFATQLGARTVEFTTPAVSSTPLHDMMLNTAQRDPANAEAGIRLTEQLEALLPVGDPRIRYVQTRRHGHLLIEVAGDALQARFFELPSEACQQRLYDAPAQVRAMGRTRRFAVDARERRLKALD